MINLKKVLKVDEKLCLILILGYGFLTHLYLLARYGGLPASGDAAVFTQAIQDFQINGGATELFYYGNGLGFQILVTEISSLSGVAINQIQMIPIGFLFLICAYLLFLELSDNHYTALLGAIILSLIPDILWVTNRGSHERYTLFLFLLALFILVRYLKTPKSSQKTVKYIIILNFSLITLGVINIVFFVLLVTSILITAILGLMLSLFFKMEFYDYKKISFSIIPMIPLSFFILGYLTPSKFKIFNNLTIWLNKFLNFLNFQLLIFSSVLLILILVLIIYFFHKRNGPPRLIINLLKSVKKITLYPVIIKFGFFVVIPAWLIFIYYFVAPTNTAFLSPEIYFFLTIIYWIILPISGIGSLIVIKKFLIDRDLNYKTKSLASLMFLSFFGIMCLCIIVDKFIYTGIGQNLELRVFPYFLIFSAFIASCALSEISTNIENIQWRKIFTILMVIACIIFSINSMLKATNDPLVSNFKMYYSSEENGGFDYMESNIGHSSIWFEEDRVMQAFKFDSQYATFKRFQNTGPDNAEILFLSGESPGEFNNSDSFTKVYDNSKVTIFRKN